jgi:glutathione S-transferase
MLELYFAPGACSFVPHVALELIQAKTGHAFETRLVKMHKAAEFLALNPNGQVPVLVADGTPLDQLIAIIDYLDRRFPNAGLLPTELWARTQAMSRLAWMNSAAHPTFAHVILTHYFAQSDAAKSEVKALAASTFRGHLERVASWLPNGSGFLHGEHAGVLDAYAWTLLRWGGFAAIDPASLPGYLAYARRVMAEPAVAAVLARERITLDTYKPA